MRLRIVGLSSRPRLSVFRSNSHIYAQIIDDADGRTLVSASSCDPGLKDKLKSGGILKQLRWWDKQLLNGQRPYLLN